MNTTRWFVLALVALTLAACGSSDSSDEDSSSASSETVSTAAKPASGANATEPLSKAQLVTKANKVCSDTGKRIPRIQKPDSKADYPAMQKKAEDGAGVLDDAAQRFGDLTPPDSVESDYAAFVASFENLATQYHKLADAAAADDADGVQEAFAASEDQTPVTLAAKLGFNC